MSQSFANTNTGVRPVAQKKQLTRPSTALLASKPKVQDDEMQVMSLREKLA